MRSISIWLIGRPRYTPWTLTLDFVKGLWDAAVDAATAIFAIVLWLVSFPAGMVVSCGCWAWYGVRLAYGALRCLLYLPPQAHWLTRLCRALNLAGILLSLAAIAILLTGCAHKSTIGLDNTPALIARPDFHSAALAAPEWTRASLKTIARLEYEVAAAAPFGVEVIPTPEIAQEGSAR